MARTVSQKKSGKSKVPAPKQSELKRTLWRSKIGLAERNGENMVSRGTQTTSTGPDFMPLTQYLAMELNATSRKNTALVESNALLEDELKERNEVINQVSAENLRLEEMLDEANNSNFTMAHRIMRLQSQLNCAKWLLDRWDEHSTELERLLVQNRVVSSLPPISWQRPSVQHRLRLVYVFATPMEPVDEESSDEDTTQSDLEVEDFP